MNPETIQGKRYTPSAGVRDLVREIIARSASILSVYSPTYTQIPLGFESKPSWKSTPHTYRKNPVDIGGNHEERQALNCLNVFPVDVLAVKNLYLPVIAPIARIWFPERTVWVTSSSDPVLGLETTGYVAKEMGGISNSIDTKFLSLR